MARKTKTKPFWGSEETTKRIRQSLEHELLQASTPQQAAVRVAARLAKQKKQQRISLKKITMTEEDPLRAAFKIPPDAQYLPKEDIRTALLNTVSTKKTDSFRLLLQKASYFSEGFLKPLLGEAIWALGKPVGFADAQERVLLFQVNSSARAHEAHFYKNELMLKLKPIPIFQHLKEIKFTF